MFAMRVATDPGSLAFDSFPFYRKPSLDFIFILMKGEYFGKTQGKCPNAKSNDIGF